MHRTQNVRRDLFIKLKLGRVGKGRALHLGPSWHGPILCGPSWHGPSWFLAELSCTPRILLIGDFTHEHQKLQVKMSGILI